MVSIRLNISDAVYDDVVAFLDSLPSKDIQIIKKDFIGEVEPTKLPQNHFDYMNEEELTEIDEMLDEAKKNLSKDDCSSITVSKEIFDTVVMADSKPTKELIELMHENRD
jgi:hypothetical protein